MVNCLSCIVYVNCRDKKKSRQYCCSRHIKQSGSNVQDLLNLKDAISSEPSLSNDESDNKDEMDLVKLLDDAFSSRNRVPPDIKIDDRDIPEHPNFFDFCMSKKGLDTPPFARQLAIGLHLFAEFCPNKKCTNPKFRDIKNVPVDYPAVDFPGQVTMLQHGVCPKCGHTKGGWVRNNRLNHYSELAACIGQRAGKCIETSTLIITTNGIRTIGSYAKSRSYGFTPLSIDVATGNRVVKTKSFYREKPATLLEMVLDNGYSLTGTQNHPVLTLNGFLTLEYIRDKATPEEDGTKEEVWVPIQYGQNVWGDSLSKQGCVLNEISIIVDAKCDEDNEIGEKFLNEFSTFPIHWGRLTLDHATLLGYWVSDNHAACLHDTTEILEVCTPAFLSLFTSDSLWRIEDIATKAKLYIEALLGYPSDVRSTNTKIPQIILEAPKQYVATFLQALFEGDGYTYSDGIGYATFSRVLSEQVSICLHNIGIVHKIVVDSGWVSNNLQNQERSSSYIINITGSLSCIVFRREIGFFSEKKRVGLDKIIQSLAGSDKGTQYWYDLKPNLPLNQEVVKNQYWTKVASVTSRKVPEESMDFEIPDGHRFVTNGIISHNSSAVALYSAYVIHKYLKLQKPLEVFNLMRGSIITATFVALTYSRAVRLLWMPLHNHLSSSPWFNAYHEVLDHYSNKHGREIYKLRDQIVEYPHRSLLMSPSGPNRKTLRGDSRFIGAVDELGLFSFDKDSDNKERAGADEVYISLDNSMLTLRSAALKLLQNGYNNIPTAYGFYVSSPYHPRDKIMSLVRDHENSREVYTVHLPTWEMNPNIPQNSPFIKKHYLTNPVKAERDFGANPALNENPYVYNDSLLYRLATGGVNRVQYKYEHKKDNVGRNMRYASITNLRSDGKIRRSVLAIDAGFSNNSFAVVVGHPRISLQNELTFHLDTFIEVAPTPGATVLNYTKIAHDLLYPLIEGLNVGIVVADRWNSLKLLHDVEDNFGILGLQYSMKYPDFLYVKDHLEDLHPNIVLPRPEMSQKEILTIDQNNYPKCFRYLPISHFYFQCLTVNDTGKTVIKGLNLTDDLFRAATLCLTQMFDEDLMKRHILNKDRNSNRGVGVIGSPLRSPISMASNIGAVGTNSSILLKDTNIHNTFARQ